MMIGHHWPQWAILCHSTAEKKTIKNISRITTINFSDFDPWNWGCYHIFYAHSKPTIDSLKDLKLGIYELEITLYKK